MPTKFVSKTTRISKHVNVSITVRPKQTTILLATADTQSFTAVPAVLEPKIKQFIEAAIIEHMCSNPK